MTKDSIISDSFFDVAKKAIEKIKFLSLGAFNSNDINKVST
ncbi:hypothetical protein BN424_1857 [Carnobacterium maltaromaticum LMA28]|uniref:Uncharacterized protein n=2 Tax=Carnobacteriaceae TaxID=186828 RepID=K8EHH8_CARML|nr:hypothetical protein BN424_1857 [Carnobacterium maltaromaticum LMA28]